MYCLKILVIFITIHAQLWNCSSKNFFLTAVLRGLLLATENTRYEEKEVQISFESLGKSKHCLD